MTKIIFMGTPSFSVPILRMLHEEGHTISYVVTQPDRPVGRKRVLTPTPVKEEALRLGLPILQPEKLKGSSEMEEIIRSNPDLIITAAFGQLLPKEILDAPRLGSLNVHASLLPEYRGGAPIHQAIIEGKDKTGVTIMYMAEKLDAGDIISQVEVRIELTDHTGSMFEKLSDAGSKLLKETLPDVLNGVNPRIPQDETKVTYAWNISREQERIDWTNEGMQIYNQIRGLHPWPVAYTLFDGQTVKVWWGEPEETNKSGEPGEIIGLTKDRIVVKTGDRLAIGLTDIQPAGKKRIAVSDFLNGAGSKIQIGDRFE